MKTQTKLIVPILAVIFLLFGCSTQSTLSFLQPSGSINSQTDDAKTPYDVFLREAEQGNSSAQYSLGVMYATGKGVEQNYKEAARWYRKSADQNNPDALNSLGSLYCKGQGVRQDYDEALKLYRLSAEQKNPHAQYNLGVMYAKGQGTPQDYAEAINWLCLAAERRTSPAYFRLDVLQRHRRRKGLQNCISLVYACG
jgi:TPR repeat protein